MPLFCYALLCVHSSFAINLKRKRNLVASLLLSYICIVTINVLWQFLTVPWVGLQYEIVVCPNHTHLLFSLCYMEVDIIRFGEGIIFGTRDLFNISYSRELYLFSKFLHFEEIVRVKMAVCFEMIVSET